MQTIQRGDSWFKIRYSKYISNKSSHIQVQNIAYATQDHLTTLPPIRMSLDGEHVEVSKIETNYMNLFCLHIK